MILVALRMVLGVALAYGFSKVWQNEQNAPQTGDLANAFYLAVCVILAIVNAIVWAPFFADSVSGPLTGVMTQSTYVDRANVLLQFVHWLERRGLRRLTAWFCFLEGIHHPDRPAAFLIGLSNARRGSRLEKVFARELFGFDNAQNCLLAYKVLRRHHVDPRPHHNPEVNMLLMSLEREDRPNTGPVPIPPAPTPAPLKRDRRIRIFEMAAPDAAAGGKRISGAGMQDPALEPAPPPDPTTEEAADGAAELEAAGPVETSATGGEKAGWLGRLRTFLRTH